MSTLDKNMEQIFDLTPTVLTGEVVESPTKVVSDSSEYLDVDLKADYIKSRDNLNGIIKKGITAIDDMLEIAKASEHPRAFEVAAVLIKNVTDANEKLLVMQKQMRDMTNHKDASSVSVENAIFVGSTTELLKAIRNKDNGNN